MRKLVIIIISLSAVLSVSCGCSKQSLPISDYPLSADTVEAAVEKVGFSWTISREDSWAENHTVYELDNDDEKLIAFISNAGEDDKRFFSLVSFSSWGGSSDIMVPLLEEEWEKAIVLATILYGGFEDENQVYENFKDTYGESTLTYKTIEDDFSGNSPERTIIIWDNEVEGINCSISFSQQGEDPLITEIVNITFYNSDEFVEQRSTQ